MTPLVYFLYFYASNKMEAQTSPLGLHTYWLSVRIMLLSSIWSLLSIGMIRHFEILNPNLQFNCSLTQKNLVINVCYFNCAFVQSTIKSFEGGGVTQHKKELLLNQNRGKIIIFSHRPFHIPFFSPVYTNTEF